jgi:tight adherence protein C
MSAVLPLWALMAGGLMLVAQFLPTPQPPSLQERVLPYLGRPEWRPHGRHPIRGRWSTPSSFAARLGGWASHLSWISGGSASAQRRLDVLGDTRSIEQYRVEQLAWGAASAASVAALLALRGVQASQWLSLVIAITLGGLAGLLARDRRLTTQVRRHGERVRSELPTIVEMLAMTVSAGSGLTSAIERVSLIGSGAVAAELQRVLADVRMGLPLIPALHHMTDRSESTELRRFVDAVVVSVERGTPLADVLVAQAADSREAERQALIESGGRKEIGMMVPVVFLVLPLSVVFVLFPGFYGLQLGS